MKKGLTGKTTSAFLIMLIVLTCFIISCMSVSAITGKIGNGRMIINLEKGDSIERSILVINDNNVSVNISMWAAGNLSSRIKLAQTNFVLKPGEQKKAGFTLSAGNKAGRDEGKINVQFKPMGLNESGVGLASQIILNVYDKGKLPGENNTADDGSDNNPTGNETDNGPGKISETWKNISDSIKEKITGIKDKINNNKAALFLGLITIILVVGLIILRRIAKSKNKKKDEKTEGSKKIGEKGGELKKLKHNGDVK
jgi:hypothetical protein